MSDWRDNINAINEIYPGHFQIILDFATTRFLHFVLRDDYAFVWVHNHNLKESYTWNKYELSVFENYGNLKVLARNLSFDFIMPTDEFKNYLSKLEPGITLVQLNNLPKPYLDPSRIKGKTRYDLLLKECDYLFEIDLPNATDYGTMVSSNKQYLESLLDNPEIDWNDLP
jgi:hypothetical protein